MRSTILIAMTFLALIMLAPATHAQTSEGSSMGGSPQQRQAMMKDRMAACANKSSGNPCSFTSRAGKAVSGTCQATRRGQLACRTGKATSGQGMGGRMGGGMPRGDAFEH